MRRSWFRTMPFQIQFFVTVSGDLLEIQFVKDATSKSYERTVFSFLEVTGNIGGLFEVLNIGGGFLVGVFSSRIFMFSVLSKLYQVETPRSGEGNFEIVILL